MNLPKVVVAHSNDEEDQRQIRAFITHLKGLEQAAYIDLWCFDRIGPGANTEDEIRQAVSNAKLVILLVSASFLSSEREEVRLIKELIFGSENLVIWAVIIKACAWQAAGWGTTVEIRPQDRMPVWRSGGNANVDEYLQAIVEEISNHPTIRTATSISLKYFEPEALYRWVLNSLENHETNLPQLPLEFSQYLSNATNSYEEQQEGYRQEVFSYLEDAKKIIASLIDEQIPHHLEEAKKLMDDYKGARDYQTRILNHLGKEKELINTWYDKRDELLNYFMGITDIDGLLNSIYKRARYRVEIANSLKQGWDLTQVFEYEEILESLTPAEFENFAGWVLRQSGWNINPTDLIDEEMQGLRDTLKTKFNEFGKSSTWPKNSGWIRINPEVLDTYYIPRL